VVLFIFNAYTRTVVSTSTFLSVSLIDGQIQQSTDGCPAVEDQKTSKGAAHPRKGKLSHVRFT
jgi:hypothetical protein